MSEDGLTVKAGAAETVSVTAIVAGLLDAPDAVTVIDPLYVPAAKAAGLTVTVAFPGVVPLAGLTASQEPPLAARLYERPLVPPMLIACPAGTDPPV